MLHLLRPRSAAVGHVLQMSFARGGVFADWVVRESVGSTRPSSVLSGSCRFVPSCLTMWPHMGLIGRVFLNRWCRLQKDAARWDRALPQSDPQRLCDSRSDSQEAERRPLGTNAAELHYRAGCCGAGCGASEKWRRRAPKHAIVRWPRRACSSAARMC